jgi:hypothetical protein
MLKMDCIMPAPVPQEKTPGRGNLPPAYYQGMSAFHRMETLLDCPYTDSTSNEAVFWRRGLIDASMEDYY